MPAHLFPLLTVSVIAATPVTPQPWFDFMQDYPMKAFEKNWEGVTEFELLIAPDGSIARCNITKSSGHEEFDKKTCFLTEKRVRFRPARDSDGRPVWGVYRSEMKWALPEHQLPSPAAADVEVSLNKLPAGAIDPPAVKLAYSVDAQGNPSSCTLMPSSLKQPKILVDLGCKELLQIADHEKVIGPNGQPVPAVKTGAVLFKTSQ